MIHTYLTPETLGLIGFGLAAALITLNVLTFSAFAVDRRRAASHLVPLPEVLLLGLAALGGWPAAKLAQLFMRNGTHTTQFRSLLNLVALPLFGVVGLVIYDQVDLWAVEAKVMTFVEQQTGTGESAGAAAQAAVAGVDGAVVAEKVLPKRFGPGANAKAGSVGKTVSARLPAPTSP